MQKISTMFTSNEDLDKKVITTINEIIDKINNLERKFDDFEYQLRQIKSSK